MRQTSIALAMLATLSAFSTVVHAQTLTAPQTSRDAALVSTSFLSASTADSTTFTFSGLTLAGFRFSQLSGSAVGFLTGTLTSVSINATLDASVADTYANDLTVYVNPGELATGGLLQLGGYSDLGASERHDWANGGSPDAGTVVSDAYTLATALTFTGTSADPFIWLGNGYGADGTEGTWSGTVTLNGLSMAAVVPEPSSWALMALGALGMMTWVSRRRRSDQA